MKVVIVGAGVIGCSIAVEMSRGGWEVTVVDKGAGAGMGSTSASSAVVRFNYSTLEGVVTSWVAARRWRQWGDYLGVPDPSGLARFHVTGKLMIEPPGTDHARVFAILDRVGVPYEVWDSSVLRARLPALDPGRYGPPSRPDDPRFWSSGSGSGSGSGEVAAYFTPDAGFVDDPMLAAHNLMVAAQHHGARFLFRTPVVGIRPHAVVLSEPSGGSGPSDLSDRTIEADVIVNAAGPWSAACNAMAGVLDDFAITTRALRTEVHVVDAPADFSLGAGGVTCADLDLGTYFRPQPGGTILVGGVEPECDPLEWIDDADDFNDQPTVEVWRAQTLRLARRVPSVRLPNRPRGLAGLYDVTPDWVPIYDRTSVDGFFVAIGTSGNQFKNAPVVGELMRVLIDAVQSGHDHDADPVQVDLGGGMPPVDMGHYSRLRQPLNTSGSVMG